MLLNNLHGFSEIFQLKIYEFEEFNVITTHKIASSVIDEMYKLVGIDYFKISLNFEITDSVDSNYLKFENILKNKKKIYILYRNPISRCVSAFFQTYQNENNFRFWIADEPTDTLFDEYKYLLHFFSEDELLMYNKKIGSNLHEMEAFICDVNEDVYLNIFEKILTNKIEEKINNGIIRLSSMNSPYLLAIYKLINDYNINYSLINTDSNRVDLILQRFFGNYTPIGYVNSKPKVRYFIENIINKNLKISNVIRQVHFEEIFIYNQLEKLENNLK